MLDSYFPKKLFLSASVKALKSDEKRCFLMLKALFVLEIFTLLPLLFGCVEKWRDKKAKVNLKIHDVTD